MGPFKELVLIIEIIFFIINVVMSLYVEGKMPIILIYLEFPIYSPASLPHDMKFNSQCKGRSESQPVLIRFSFFKNVFISFSIDKSLNIFFPQ